MIKVFIKKSNKRITGFRIDGHAGYDEKGKDIVCAAVSMLGINCVNSIEQLSDDEYSADVKDGYLDFSLLTDEPSVSTKVLLDSFMIGINGVVASYGDEYVKLINCKEEKPC